MNQRPMTASDEAFYTPGELYDKDTLFLRVTVGTATSETGIEYEMTIHGGNSAPMIRSSETGKYYILSWEDILDLAIKKGIDEHDIQSDKEADEGPEKEES